MSLLLACLSLVVRKPLLINTAVRLHRYLLVACGLVTVHGICLLTTVSPLLVRVVGLNRYSLVVYPCCSPCTTSFVIVKEYLLINNIQSTLSGLRGCPSSSALLPVWWSQRQTQLDIHPFLSRRQYSNRHWSMERVATSSCLSNSIG